MNDTVSSQEALMMLDLDINEEMQTYKQQLTKLVVKHINMTPRLYAEVRKIKEGSRNSAARRIRRLCIAEAENNDGNFGDIILTEMDQVNWAAVSRMV